MMFEQIYLDIYLKIFDNTPKDIAFDVKNVLKAG